MDAIVQMVYEAALPYRPCDLFTGLETIDDLMRKFLTARGAEFCIRNDFPSRDICSIIRNEKVSKNGVYIDYGALSLDCPQRIAIIGDCDFTLYCNSNDYASRIILMKGATVHIKASNYAVVSVQAQRGCKCYIEKTDRAKVQYYEG